MGVRLHKNISLVIEKVVGGDEILIQLVLRERELLECL